MPARDFSANLVGSAGVDTVLGIAGYRLGCPQHLRNRSLIFVQNLERLAAATQKAKCSLPRADAHLSQSMTNGHQTSCPSCCRSAAVHRIAVPVGKSNADCHNPAVGFHIWTLVESAPHGYCQFQHETHNSSTRIPVRWSMTDGRSFAHGPAPCSNLDCGPSCPRSSSSQTPLAHSPFPSSSLTVASFRLMSRSALVNAGSVPSRSVKLFQC